ncbi:173R [Cherax quadricarinatus iridovirus]|uniref:Uncharacterized protein n=1 Tax=Shrimp hemocyte iridescent virus TaxID=2039780 RepID=A0A291B0Y9_9VIRU|nr:173R [Cherax quadricarinatus iridovirus]YP_010084906.1 hypothetical protein KM509_gp154 [Shrimp hemocyte iridescent virus]UPA43317.1 hypothetical protein 4TH000043 [Iridovirus CN01]ASZ85153.1 173R [Cherax quadricarinatus iridovirus]ATE87163.1 hypothetical protein [Shrimp hemocyte iridescent virus]UPA43552.1 hypothetical protein 3TG000119 [Iridovirus CN01]UPA43749.1 hypothetical protein 1DG000157 [Iridovirus CN01]
MNNFKINSIYKCRSNNTKGIDLHGKNKIVSDINWNDFKITNLKYPENDQDLITKKYIQDEKAAGNIYRSFIFDDFIESGSERTIDFSENPDWTVMMINIRLFLVLEIGCLFRHQVGVVSYYTGNGDMGPTTDFFKYKIFGEAVIKNIDDDANKITIAAQNFGYIKLTENDKEYKNEALYGIAGIEFI